MLLSKLICELEYKCINNNTDVEITGICYDSKKIAPGNIFVCIPGYITDGHSFINEAVGKKAAAIIAEKEVETEDIPVITVNDARKALAVVSAAFYSHPEREVKVIGVTGTNGKTTTAYMIKNLLEHCGYKAGLMGTVENIIGDKCYPASMTTPEATEIYKTLRAMADEKVNYAVMEVSSHALYLKRVYGIEFSIGVMTNVTPEHLDFHKTMEDYARTKAMLFENSRISVINSDSDYAEIMKASAKKYVTYGGNEENADVCSYNVLSNIEGISFNVKNVNEDYRICLNMPGDFNRENALSVAGVAYALGIPSGFVRLSFKRFKGVPGRVEKIKTGRDFDVIIDYAHTPDGLERVIKAVGEFTEGRLITLFGCGGDRDKSKRSVMGKISTTLSDFTVITSDNPRSEDPAEIIDDILEGCVGGNFKVIPDRREAIRYALSVAGKKDTVLIAGKGHEKYQITAEGRIEFDEKKIIGELL